MEKEESILFVNNLEKSYGDEMALEDFSFSLKPSRIYERVKAMKRLIKITLILTLLLLATTNLTLANSSINLTGIEIKGNDHIAKETITQVIESKVNTSLDRNQLKKDIQSIYDLGFFKDVSVSFQRFKGGVKAIIHVKENPVIKKIIIKGNKKTKDFVILRELKLQQGQIININIVKKGLQNLYKLQYFKKIKPEFKRVNKKSNSLNLIINVTEKETGKFEFGGGYSSKDGWIGMFKIKEKNLMGNGQSLDFKWDFGGKTSYSLGFREPWLMGTPTSFDINVYDSTSQGLDLIKGDYQKHRQGGSISLGHDLSKAWKGKVGLRLESSNIKWKNDSYLKNGEVKSLINENNNLRSLSFKVSRNTTNYPFNPTKGALDTLGIEYSGKIIGSDVNYNKYNFDFRRFYPGFKSGQVWALRFKSGIGNGNIPEAEKYRMGGANTLRGYEQGIFSGNDMVLLNAEYRFNIIEKFTGVLFVDSGNTWNKLEQINLGKMHNSVGAGLRMNTPVGQIRLDYGFAEDGSGMPHFSIGQTF